MVYYPPFPLIFVSVWGDVRENEKHIFCDYRVKTFDISTSRYVRVSVCFVKRSSKRKEREKIEEKKEGKCKIRI